MSDEDNDAYDDDRDFSWQPDEADYLAWLENNEREQLHKTLEAQGIGPEVLECLRTGILKPVPRDQRTRSARDALRVLEDPELPEREGQLMKTFLLLIVWDLWRDAEKHLRHPAFVMFEQQWDRVRDELMLPLDVLDGGRICRIHWSFRYMFDCFDTYRESLRSNRQAAGRRGRDSRRAWWPNVKMEWDKLKNHPARDRTAIIAKRLRKSERTIRDVIRKLDLRKNGNRQK
jgi:hypothetical protein